MVLGSYMILNLLIAIMLSQFKIVMHQDEQLVKLDDITNFVEVWARFDPEKFDFVDISSVFQLVEMLDEPLGPRIDDSLEERARWCRQMADKVVCTKQGKVHLIELFVCLAKEIAGRNEVDEIDITGLDAILREIVSEFPSMYHADLSLRDMARGHSSAVAYWFEMIQINRVDSQRYAALLAELGVDTVQDIILLDDEELEPIYTEAKLAHKTKIRERVALLRSGFSIASQDHECRHCPLHCVDIEKSLLITQEEYSRTMASVRKSCEKREDSTIMIYSYGE